MTPKPTDPPKTAASPEPKTAPAGAAADPTVRLDPEFEVGQRVRHVSGTEFEIHQIFPAGIALVGVANLISPSALEPVVKKS